MNVATKNAMNIDRLTSTSIGVNAKDKELSLKVLNDIALPTTRDESWKYTRVSKLGKIDFQSGLSNIENIDKYTILNASNTLVFINGIFSEDHSTAQKITGIEIEELSSTTLPETKVKIEGEIFNALNTAYLNGGVKIKISKNSLIEDSIQIIHIMKGDNIISNFKTIIEAEAFSKAHIVQGFFTESGNNNFCNNTSEISVGDNAFLTVDKIQYESLESFHINTEQVSQEANSTFTINTITLNGGLVRNNLNIDVNGENCTSNLNGVYLLKDKQLVDNHSIVDHRVPNCESNELYKGVIDNNSTAVFNGKVFVRQDAQKINAFQSNGNVLLSDDATVNSKPELEIYADDVKCSHGSTTGQLDDEAIFYLRARGISEKAAKQLMVSAFIADVLDKIENEAVLDFVYSKLKERFDWDF